MMRMLESLVSFKPGHWSGRTYFNVGHLCIQTAQVILSRCGGTPELDWRGRSVVLQKFVELTRNSDIPRVTWNEQKVDEIGERLGNIFPTSGGKEQWIDGFSMVTTLSMQPITSQHDNKSMKWLKSPLNKHERLSEKNWTTEHMARVLIKMCVQSIYCGR